MEDLQWLFLILLAIIIWVVRMWLKAFSSQTANNNNRPEKQKAYPIPSPPPTSYQEILKEMQASGNRAKKSEQPVSMETRSTIENTSREARSLEKINRPARSLESLAKEPVQKLKRPSAIDLTRHEKKIETTTMPTSVNYSKLLRNPQNVRTAFIFSEVLNRRVDY